MPEWSYVAGPFQAFEHRFAIGTNDEELGPYLDRMWAACRADVEPATVYALEADHPARRYRLHADQTAFSETDNASVALRDLVRRVNAGAIADAGNLVVVHAAGAAKEGKGVLFPAAMESGKTTLVAALVRSGWSYLSDEAVGIDPHTLELVGYPKPLSVDPGSWEVLADLRPEVPPAVEVYINEQWQLPPDEVGAVTASAVSTAIVVPSYEPNSMPRTEGLSRPQALRLLADSCFTLRQDPQNSLMVLAALGRRCATYQVWFHAMDGAFAAAHMAVSGD